MDRSAGQSRQGIGAWGRDGSPVLDRGSVEPFPLSAVAGGTMMSGSAQAPARETSQTVDTSSAEGLVSVWRQATGVPPAEPAGAGAFTGAQHRAAASQGGEQPLIGDTELGEGEGAGREEPRAGGEPQEGVPMASQQEDPMMVCQGGEGDLLVSEPPQEQQGLSEGAGVAKEPATLQRPRPLHEGYAARCAELGIQPPAALMKALEKVGTETGDASSSGNPMALVLPLAQMSDAVIFSLADFLAEEDARSKGQACAPIDARGEGLAAQGSGAALLHLLRSAGARLREADLSNMPLGRDTFRDLFHNGLMAQTLGLAHCRVRKFDLVGPFPELRALVLDHNPAILGLPEGCFAGAPRLASVSLCATGLHNPWTATAALAALPGLRELRFQRCACCASSTAHCDAAQAEEDAHVARVMAYQRQARQPDPAGGAPAPEGYTAADKERERQVAMVARVLFASGERRQGAEEGEDEEAERRALLAWEEARGRGPSGEAGTQNAAARDSVVGLGTLATMLRDALMPEGGATGHQGPLGGMPGWAQLLAETGYEDSGPVGVVRGRGGGVRQEGDTDDEVMGDGEAVQEGGEGEYEEGEEEEDGAYEEDEGEGEEEEVGEEDFEDVEGGGEEEYEEEGEAGEEEGAEEEDFAEEELFLEGEGGEEEEAPGRDEDRDEDLTMLLLQRSLDMVGEAIPGAVLPAPPAGAGQEAPAGDLLVRQDSDQPMEDAFLEASRARQWHQESAGEEEGGVHGAPGAAGNLPSGIRRLIFGQGPDAAAGAPGAPEGEGAAGGPEVGEGHAEGGWASRDEGPEALLAVECLALQESRSSTMNSLGSSSGLGVRTASTSSSSTSLSSQGGAGGANVGSNSRSSSRNSSSSDAPMFTPGSVPGSTPGSAPGSGPNSTGSISSASSAPYIFSPLGTPPATFNPFLGAPRQAGATVGAQGPAPVPLPGASHAPLPPLPPQAASLARVGPAGATGTGQRSGGPRRRAMRAPVPMPAVFRDAAQGSGAERREGGANCTGNGTTTSSSRGGAGAQREMSAAEAASMREFLHAYFRQRRLRHASPLCALPLYRPFMITRLPGLEVLDNLAITPQERAEALEVFSVHFEPYAYGLLHTENMLQLLQRREAQTCGPVPGAARSAALRRRKRQAPFPRSLTPSGWPLLAPPTATAAASSASSSGGAPSVAPGSAPATAASASVPGKACAVRNSMVMGPWPSRGLVEDSPSGAPVPASLAGTTPQATDASGAAPAAAAAASEHGAPAPAAHPELAVGPRRLGLAVTVERQRGGKSAAGFKRALGASRVQACTWVSSRPMACNPEGRGTGGAASQRPVELHRRYRPRQFEYHPTDPHLMVFGTLHGEVVVVNHEAERIVGQVQSIGAPHSILGLCWLNRDPSKLIGGCDNGSIQLYDINHMRASYLASIRPRAQGAAGAAGAPAIAPTMARPGMAMGAGQGHGAGAATAPLPPAAVLAGGGMPRPIVARFGAAAGPVLAPPNAQALGLAAGMPGGAPGAGAGAGGGAWSSWDTVRNPAIYTYEDFEQLTSVHVNCTDDFFVASGYSNHVGMYDVRTGRRLHVFPNLHKEHINVLKFSHHSPHLFATSSFDRDIKLWDARQRIHADGQNPIYSVRSKRGNVMVCFSPDDSFLLASAIDNEVRQYVASDGRLQMTCDIQPLNSQHNYTRSYYMNGRDYIVSGSCEENIVRICCARTGRRLRDVVLEGKGGRNSLYVQSLRGDPFRDFHLSVLVAYSHPNSRSEIVKVNLVGNSNSGSAHSADFQDFPMASVGA